MEQRQLLIGVEARFRRHELENVDAGQCPAVTGDDGAQFALALRQSDVKAALPPANALQQKLQRQGGLAGARAPFDQIDAIGIEAAAENIVQPGAAGRDRLRLGVCGRYGFWAWLSPRERSFSRTGSRRQNKLHIQCSTRKNRWSGEEAGFPLPCRRPRRCVV